MSSSTGSVSGRPPRPPSSRESAGSPVAAAIAAAAIAAGFVSGSDRDSVRRGGARGGASSPAPSSVKEEVLTKHRYTMMSHPLTLKAALVLKDGMASEVPVDPIISDSIGEMLCRTQIESDDAVGALRAKPIEKTLTAVDMDSIKNMVPLYFQTVASSVSINSQQYADGYIDLATSSWVPTPHSSAVWSFDQLPFSQQFGLHKVSCLHQMTTGDTNLCSLDGLIGIRHPTVLGRMFPLCQLECAFGQDIDTKIGQSCSYFNKLYAQLSHGCRYPILSIRYNSEMIAFDVYFKPPAVDEDPEAVGRIPLHKTQIPFNAQSIHAMMKLVAFWVQTFSSMYNPATQQWDIGQIDFKKDQTCLEVDGRMFKLFSNEDGSARKPGQYFNYMPHSCCIQGWLNQDEYYILSYPKIVGTHWPSHSGHIVSLVESALSLGLQIHGDIRLFNLVFHSQDGGMSIIDWDLSGSQADAYPACYNHDIGPDGARHPGARAGLRLDKIHDVYAVLALLHKFQLQDPEANEKYHALLPALDTVSCDQRFVLLSPLLVSLKNLFGDGTGFSIMLPTERELLLHNSGTGSIRLPQVTDFVSSQIGNKKRKLGAS